MPASEPSKAEKTEKKPELGEPTPKNDEDESTWSTPAPTPADDREPTMSPRPTQIPPTTDEATSAPTHGSYASILPDFKSLDKSIPEELPTLPPPYKWVENNAESVKTGVIGVLMLCNATLLSYVIGWRARSRVTRRRAARAAFRGTAPPAYEPVDLGVDLVGARPAQGQNLPVLQEIDLAADLAERGLGGYADYEIPLPLEPPPPPPRA